MALIKCNECNKEISDMVENCIHCGAPKLENSVNESFNTRKQNPKSLFSKLKKYFWYFDENISGTTYFLRIILCLLLYGIQVVFHIPFLSLIILLLISATTYKRLKAFNLKSQSTNILLTIGMFVAYFYTAMLFFGISNPQRIIESFESSKPLTIFNVFIAFISFIAFLYLIFRNDNKNKRA